MRILFIGCVESSYMLLENLLKNDKNVVGVITKDKSDFNADFVDLQPLCSQYNVPIHTVNNVNDKDSLAFIKDSSPDIGYCFGWSQLIRSEIINLFPKGVVGFHPTALPYNRGRHPLIWTLVLGLDKTASTFFMINAGADEGDIISREFVEITYEDDARTLYDKVMDVAVSQEQEFTDAFEQGAVQFTPQDINMGNVWRKRSKIDGQIDWRMSSRSVYNLVRALTRPYVGAHFIYQNQEYKVWKVAELNIEGLDNFEPGKVLAVNDDNTIDVKVADGAIRLIDYDRLHIGNGEYIL